jgi:hypothetical protein
MPSMPRYLRWLMAVSTGLTSQFIFFILVGAIALGTNKKELGQGIGLLAVVGATFATVIPALAINDWLANKYPIIRDDPSMGAQLPPQPTSGEIN